MKVSYAITVKDELEELRSLLSNLGRYLSEVKYENEIVILQDGNNPTIMDFITHLCITSSFYRHYTHDLNMDFASHKNFLNSKCDGDFIFQIDADESPSSILVDQLDVILEANPTVDLYWVPRVNTVSGLTTEHIVKWGWKTQVLEDVELMVVNWPDYQSRIYRNNPNIQWEGRVHERIIGANKYTKLLEEPMWALLHPKTIEKQERQNAMYATIQR